MVGLEVFAVTDHRHQHGICSVVMQVPEAHILGVFIHKFGLKNDRHKHCFALHFRRQDPHGDFTFVALHRVRNGLDGVVHVPCHVGGRLVFSSILRYRLGCGVSLGYLVLALGVVGGLCLGCATCGQCEYAEQRESSVTFSCHNVCLLLV